MLQPRLISHSICLISMQIQHEKLVDAMQHACAGERVSVTEEVFSSLFILYSFSIYSFFFRVDLKLF